jgi:hypothetical protein
VVDEPRERRKYERVKLLKPLPGKVGNARVFVMELGISGMQIAHQGVLPRPGQRFKIEFEWEARRLQFECEVVHNDLQKLAKKENEKSTYNAGAHFVNATADSAVILRRIVIDHVERALDEQRANARGIPAVAAQMYQSGKAKEYIRCMFVNGEWRRMSSMRNEQPDNGFTVSVDEDPAQLEMLCEAYASGDADTRKMIRAMAEASISTKEGVPTRRYNP